jgi:hypothetical protein
MFSFKDQLKKDLDIFINPNEFGELHVLGSKEIMMIIEENSFGSENSRQAADFESATEALYESVKVVHLKASEFAKPSIGRRIKLDDENYYVAAASVNDGILKISLVANES